LRGGGRGDGLGLAYHVEESLQLQQLGLGRLEAGDRLGGFSMNVRKNMTWSTSSPTSGEVEGMNGVQHVADDILWPWGQLPPFFSFSCSYLFSVVLMLVEERTLMGDGGGLWAVCKREGLTGGSEWVE